MSNKQKIINDPVFGFINIPNDFIYSLIQHKYLQRLNRIKQLGLSSFVYPGAQHTRFLHSLGAMFLMNEALKQLAQKGNKISDEEKNAALIAILLHDIGHGPFSHVLESTLVHEISHEEISLLLIEQINCENNGALNTAIEIFTNTYPKHFLHQLISGQLDVDRLDYLRRDSFFTGVTEGNIGSARIIKMLNVKNDRLVVEEKGLYSIENFLIARRFMYWQVYLHKTSVAAECMLINILRRAQYLASHKIEVPSTPALSYFLSKKIKKSDFIGNNATIEAFTALDDSDITSAIKIWSKHPDKILSMLSSLFINRKLFKTEISEQPFSEQRHAELIDFYRKKYNITEKEAEYLFFEHPVSTRTYTDNDENILILYRNGATEDIAQASDIFNLNILKKEVCKFYLCSLKG